MQSTNLSLCNHLDQRLLRLLPITRRRTSTATPKDRHYTVQRLHLQTLQSLSHLHDLHVPELCPSIPSQPSIRFKTRVNCTRLLTFLPHHPCLELGLLSRMFLNLALMRRKSCLSSRL